MFVPSDGRDRRQVAPLMVLALFAAACGGDDAAVAAAARVPDDGVVWEVDRPDDRAAAEGALLAYVSGLHVMVIDDDDAYAGMTRMRLTERAEGGRALTLAGGLGAELVPSGASLELRFADGQRVPLRRQAPPASLR